MLLKSYFAYNNKQFIRKPNKFFKSIWRENQIVFILEIHP